MGKSRKGKNRKQRGARRRGKARPRKQRRGESSRSAPAGKEQQLHFQFDAPRPDLCRPPVHVAPDLSVVDDPLELLGLSEREASDPERVRAAAKEALRAHPPERESELARRIREARDRLLDPDRVAERRLGVLRVPDPTGFGLPELEASKREEEDPHRLPAPARLLGQLAAYALLEDELEDGGQPVEGELPFE